MIARTTSSLAQEARRRVLELLHLLKDAAVRWSDDDCLRFGASLAYYAVFSIFPLLLLAVTVFGFVLGESPDTRTRFIDALAATTTPEFKATFDSTLHDMQEHRTARGVGAAVGLVTLVVGGSAVFSELHATLNHIWRVPKVDHESFWGAVVHAARRKALSLLVVVVAAFALLGSLVARAILTAIGHSVEGVASAVVGREILWSLVEGFGSVAILTVMLASMFRLIPDAKIAWGDVLGGAFLSSVLFTGIKHLLAWYLVHIGSYAAYGAIGGFLCLLTWIYLASLFLFFGAEFARVYAERYGSLKGRGPNSVLPRTTAS